MFSAYTNLESLSVAWVRNCIGPAQLSRYSGPAVSDQSLDDSTTSKHSEARLTLTTNTTFLSLQTVVNPLALAFGFSPLSPARSEFDHAYRKNNQNFLLQESGGAASKFQGVTAIIC